MSTGDGAGSEDDGGAAQTAETRSWSQRGERRIIRMDEWLAFTGHTNALSLKGAGHESLGREEEEKDNSVWAQSVMCPLTPLNTSVRHVS